MNIETKLHNLSEKIKTAASENKLKNPLRNKINSILTKVLDGNTYYRKAEHGLQKAVEILSNYGIEQDGVENSYVFTQDKGRLRLDLAFSNDQDPCSPTPITNSILDLSFQKMPSDRYEVVAYLS